DTIRDLASDIKIFKSKVRGLESFSKTRMSEQDFSQFRDIMDSRLSEMDASNRQSIDRLSQEFAEFGKSVGSGKLSRDDFSKAYELIETKLQDLGVMAKSSSDELRKDMVSFKRLVEERFNDIKGSQVKEFKDEISRISQLEQSTDARTDAHEKRLDELSETLASLQSMPPEIGMIREKIDSLEELSGSMVYSREFSQKINEINSSLDQFRNGLTGLDKRMHSHSASLEASIREAFGEEKLLKKTQEGMNSLIDSRISEVEKRLSSGIRGLVNDLSQSSSALSGLKENISVLNSLSAQAEENGSSLDELRKRMDSLELASRETGKKASGLDNVMKRLAKLESLSRNIIDNSEFLRELGDEHSDLKAIAGTLPRTVEKHSEAISKILESKEFLADNVAGLKSDISGLSEKLSSSQERLASLEKGFSSRGMSDESRIDELSSAVRSVETKL
ncbi:MAG: hypothetical protein KAT35_04295, partial [Candidatus Aenigmarchaeota archaeon]|nr:hypothetical protein [Candidatus Aenigmarchaeota archaeon]